MQCEYQRNQVGEKSWKAVSLQVTLKTPRGKACFSEIYGYGETQGQAIANHNAAVRLLEAEESTVGRPLMGCSHQTQDSGIRFGTLRAVGGGSFGSKFGNK